MAFFQAKNDVSWTPSDRSLPMKAVLRGSVPGGIFVILFSLARCGCLTASIIGGTIKEGVNIPMTLLLMVFMLPGVLFGLFGLGQLFGRREVFLEWNQVSVSEGRFWKRIR